MNCLGVIADLEELVLKQKVSRVARNKDLFLNNKVIQRSRYVFLASVSNIKVVVERIDSHLLWK